MLDGVTRLTNSLKAIKAAELAAQLSPSFEDRSHRLALACRAAAAIARDRRRAGLPEPKPEPWPTSTWEFLAKNARQRVKTSTDPDSCQAAEELAMENTRASRDHEWRIV